MYTEDQVAVMVEEVKREAIEDAKQKVRLGAGVATLTFSELCVCVFSMAQR